MNVLMYNYLKNSMVDFILLIHTIYVFSIYTMYVKFYLILHYIT